MTIDTDLQHWKQRLDKVHIDATLNAYTDGAIAFIPDLPPALAVQLPGGRVMELLRKRLGSDKLNFCLQSDYRHPSPLQESLTTDWLKKTNVVGINVRTIGHFWNVIKYSFTLPRGQSAIHLLPIWDPGVVASLYGIAGRSINKEFFSEELATLCPHLDTVESQLRAVVNILHALGKTVGMDVIPHVDRYSEIVLANPQHFEWLQRFDSEIVDHSADLHEAVQEAILEFAVEQGSAQPDIGVPADKAVFFSEQFGESRRLSVLLGPAAAGPERRAQRRAALIDWLFRRGLEPVPATMGPPYRGLEVDTRPESATTDHLGRVWREYRMRKPQVMSRVFGPLTRFKFYERLDDNRDWAIDFERPRYATWKYFIDFYAQVQQSYGFDFMRGDMSHVQMRPDGVPARPQEYYDPHQMVKRRIRQRTPYFAYFAETFLAAPDYMAFGDELDHLELADADVTLGDLQSVPVGDWEFMRHFRWYLDLLATRHFAPSFTIMTGDKDDPRFDRFYWAGNEARMFLSLFLTDMPSYMALGFEQRDVHRQPAPNEHYTKLYVFRQDSGPKATQGPYVWGENYALLARISRIRLQADQIWAQIEGRPVHWLIYPSPTGTHFVIAWIIEHTPYMCVVNLDVNKKKKNVRIPWKAGQPGEYHLLFSTHKEVKRRHRPLAFNGLHLHLGSLRPGEGRIYSTEEIPEMD